MPTFYNFKKDGYTYSFDDIFIPKKIFSVDSLWFWGYNSDGIITGQPETIKYSTPVAFSGGANWKKISCGFNHVAAIKTDGTLWAWGQNGQGQLGNSSSITSRTPITTFAGGNDWKEVSCGVFYTSAIKTDGTLWAWGTNNEGQLGRGLSAFNYSLRSTPVTTFAGGTNWADTATGAAEELYTMSAGYYSSSAIKTDGTLWVWGSNIINHLGITESQSLTPVTTFSGGTNWKQISFGGRFTAAIKTDGTLWAWGSNDFITLPFLEKTISTPVTTFAGGTNWADTATGAAEELYTISASNTFSAAIKTDGTLWMWGFGTNGQLGNNINFYRSTPVTTFAGGTNWKQISLGINHTAAIKTDGTLWLWGQLNNGMSGSYTDYTANTPVTTFVGGNNWKQVSCGTRHMSAIKTDGTLWTWGNNANGQLGVGIDTVRSTPVTTFAGGTNWADTATGAAQELYTISAGYFASSAIKTDGTLWIWGSSGGLATNDTLGRLTPVTTFAGGTNWKQLSSRVEIFTTQLNTSFAIKTDGTLWTWGYNGYFGVNGTNDTVNKLTPVTTFAGGNNWTQISTYYNHAGAIKTDGTLWMWGRGNFARLGTNSVLDSLTPVTTFAGGTDWKQVSVASFHSAAIKTDGTLWVWGNNSYGQLGQNDALTRSTPVTTFAGGTDWKQISCSRNGVFAIKTDGTLWVWGRDIDGQLGINVGTGNSILTPVTTFAGGTNWKQVSGGAQHIAAVKNDGTLWTWGRNIDGQLGINNTSTSVSTPVTTFAGGTNWKQVSAGSRHTIALSDDGINKRLFLFGAFDRLGISGIISMVPQQVSGNTWKQVSSGGYVTTAIKTDGTLWVWGNNNTTQLGINATGIRVTPVTTFAGGTDWKQVACGSISVTAIKTDGTLWVWGSNIGGQLGTNSFINISTPVTTFAGGTNWKQVSTNRHTSDASIAAIKTDGTLWVWGYNFSGQLGNTRITNIAINTPTTTFAGGTNWKQVDIGNDSAIALNDDGVNKRLYIWGSVTGINTILTKFPREVENNTWKQVSSGYRHSAAIKTDGTLWVWGNNAQRQLGTNDFASRLTPIQIFGGGTNWKQVSAGRIASGAIKTDGTLWVWGNATLYGNNGILGTNDVITRPSPVTTFAGGTNWKQVSFGIYHAAAVKTDGTLWIWGLNSQGQLATNDLITRSTPVTTFTGGTDWKQVSVASRFTTAIKTDGTLWVWGNNTTGQLGINDLEYRITPVTTFNGGTDWKQVHAGGSDTVLALRSDGLNTRLYVWGNNIQYKLGNNIGLPNNYSPEKIFGSSNNYKQVSSGQFHTAAVKTDGTLWLWGGYNNGVIGNNSTSLMTEYTPVTTFAGGTNWKQVSCNADHTAAVKTDGTLWAWGSAKDGQIAIGTLLPNAYTPITTFAGGTNWADTATGAAEELYTLSSGTYSTAAIKTDGTLWTFGENINGEIGVNDLIPRLTPVTTFAGGTNWKQLSTGKDFIGAIKTDGTLWVWGNNSTGQLGIDGSADRSTPVTTFAGGTDWKQVSCGHFHTSAIKTDGTLWGWGGNGSGGLGINDNLNRSTPVTTFAGGTDWKQVSCGFYYTTAIKTDGTLWVWGENFSGQLGTGDQINRITPVTTFAGGNNWKQVSSTKVDLFRNNFVDDYLTIKTAAIKTDGTLWLWGTGSIYDNYVDVGFTAIASATAQISGTSAFSSTPYTGKRITTDASSGTVTSIPNSLLGPASLTSSTTPFTGNNDDGYWELPLPFNISFNGVSYSLIYVGTNTYITFSGGSTNYSGLGIGNPAFPKIMISCADNSAQIIYYGTEGVSPNRTYRVRWEGTDNTSGLLGSPTMVYEAIFYEATPSQIDIQIANNARAIGASYTPVTTLAGGTNWKQVDCGGDHITSVKTDGTLWVWGNNVYGQLGINDSLNRITPVTTFTGGTNWKQTSANPIGSFALRDNGISKELYYFGKKDNLSGTNYTEIRGYPIEISGNQNWSQVNCGYKSTAAIKTDGTLWTWGNNYYGQLGNNTAGSNIYTPVTTFAGGTNWKQVNIGYQHTAAIKTDGTLWLWGKNQFSVLGVNDSTDRSTPVTTFIGGTNWRDISANKYISSALKYQDYI